MIIFAVISIALFFGLLGLLWKLIKKPMKWGLKLLLNAVIGYVYLFIFNFIGAWFGLSLNLSFLSCAIAGLFGLPGIIVMLVLKWFIL